MSVRQVRESDMINRRVVTIVLCFVLGAMAAAQNKATEKPPTQFEQSLMTQEKDFIAAAKKGDVEFFKRTLADDFSFVEFDGQLYERQDFLDQLGGGGIDVLAYNMKVIPISDSAGIVTYDVVLRVPAAEDQGAPPRYQHFSTTWVKQGDDWKMKFQQMTASHWGDW